MRPAHPPGATCNSVVAFSPRPLLSLDLHFNWPMHAHACRGNTRKWKERKGKNRLTRVEDTAGVGGTAGFRLPPDQVEYKFLRWTSKLGAVSPGRTALIIYKNRGFWGFLGLLVLASV